LGICVVHVILLLLPAVAVAPSVAIASPLRRPLLPLTLRCCHTIPVAVAPSVALPPLLLICRHAIQCLCQRVTVVSFINVAITPTIAVITVAVAVVPSITAAVIAVVLPLRLPLPLLLHQPLPPSPSLLPLRLPSPLLLLLSCYHCALHCSCCRVALALTIDAVAS
jgi:hypothetical protein